MSSGWNGDEVPPVEANQCVALMRDPLKAARWFKKSCDTEASLICSGGKSVVFVHVFVFSESIFACNSTVSVVLFVAAFLFLINVLCL